MSRKYLKQEILTPIYLIGRPTIFLRICGKFQITKNVELREHTRKWKLRHWVQRSVNRGWVNFATYRSWTAYNARSLNAEKVEVNSFTEWTNSVRRLILIFRLEFARGSFVEICAISGQDRNTPFSWKNRIPWSVDEAARSINDDLWRVVFHEDWRVPSCFSIFKEKSREWVSAIRVLFRTKWIHFVHLNQFSLNLRASTTHIIRSIYLFECKVICYTNEKSVMRRVITSIIQIVCPTKDT